MTRPNPDAFTTESEHEVGVINDLHISLQVWASGTGGDDRWVVVITGNDGSQSHYEVDDETAGIMIRCGSLMDQ